MSRLFRVLSSLVALAALALTSSCALFGAFRSTDPSFANAEKAALVSIYTTEAIGSLNAGLVATAQSVANSWGKDLLPGLASELRARLPAETGIVLVDDSAVVAHPSYQELGFKDPFAGTPMQSVAVPPLKPMLLSDEEETKKAGELAAAVGADLALAFHITFTASRESGDFVVTTDMTVRAVDTTGKVVWEQTEVVRTEQSLSLSDLAGLGADIGAAMVGSMREEPTKKTAMAGAREAMTTIFTRMKEAR